MIATDVTTLRTDPRVDPRIAEALAPFGLDRRVPGPPMRADAPRSEILGFLDLAEQQMEALTTALAGASQRPDDVERRTVRIEHVGRTVALHVHRPIHMDRDVPCIAHFHGGGMAVSSAADPLFVSWRDALAATGVIVVGVEFRNSAGRLGAHPFPAGLDDCVAAVRWLSANRGSLGLTHIVVAGESGGANLAMALCLRAGKEGWIDEVSGCYAMAPFISGTWGDPPAELSSQREFDGYFSSLGLYSLFAEAYDPGGEHAEDPLCWPWRAQRSDLQGLPPHIIAVDELDLLRDEGLSHASRLRQAGVSVEERLRYGATHAADVLLAVQVPKRCAATLADIRRFAEGVAPMKAGR